MTASVEQICQMMAAHRLLSSAELARLRGRWFQPQRKDATDVDKFGQWLSVNGYVSGFAFRMLRAGQADLLQLNQYQVVDHLASGPFAGSYLGLDPLRRHVVLDVLAADAADDEESVRAFQAAAERAMTVRHPNVSLTLDFGAAQGRHYLVREFNEGETLDDILAQRGKLQAVPAARLFALALQGLQALQEKQVSAGPLDSECFLLAVAGASAGSKARTVKIVNAGVSRTLFDPAALDASADKDHPRRAAETPSPPQDDLFRLGVVFYRSLTGQAPFAADALSQPTPIRQLAPDVPDMLAQLVESLLDAYPSQRPSGAAQAAKRLRVFLASEEKPQRDNPEEHLVAHTPAHVAARNEEEANAEEETANPPAGEGALAKQLKTLGRELRPKQRDLVFLGAGAAAVVVLVLFLTLLTGIHFVNLVCLLAGGALSFLVERLLRLREGQPE
jgi:serine/threonine-protein kinase